MNRIATVFNDLKNKRPVFMPFVVGGDPDFKRSLEILLAVANTADILEVGFPYSDPLADGPVIQGAGQRALLAGITPVQVFKLIKTI
jgi:tryptophan synthase alpha chain